MKKLSTFTAGLIAMLCSTTSTFAQVTVSANATATIVTPISITKTADMSFGNVAVQSSTAGTVVLATDNSRTQTGGVTLPATTGTVSAAIFTVSGEGAYTYTITLPSSLTISNSAINMTINTFTSTPSGTGTLSSGSQTLKVGATLNVAAAQAAGTYTSATPFNVTVNYN
jgi:hypothetical protein